MMKRGRKIFKCKWSMFLVKLLHVEEEISTEASGTFKQTKSQHKGTTKDRPKPRPDLKLIFLAV